ncbi:LamG domain-containing protein [Candidatus Omnitrophota bacterium]
MNAKRVILIMILIIALVPVTTYAASKGDPPVSHWRFDEAGGPTAYDDVGNNDGTLDADDIGGGSNAAVGHMWYPQGKVGGCLEFDGTDDYVNCGDNGTLDFNNNDFTVTAWVKTSSSSIGTIVNKGPSGTYGTGVPRWHVWVSSNGNGKVDAYIEDADGDNQDGGTNSHTWDSDTAINDGNWHFVTVVYILTSGSSKIYIDGIAQSDTRDLSSVDNVSNGYNVIMGFRREDVPTDYFDGTIDDVRIYDYARTADQIMVDYNAGTASYLGAGTDPNEGNPPVGWWQFNENAGTDAYDRSGNNNNGTITNATWTHGKHGNALNLDGSGDYVSISDSSSFDAIAGTSDFSIFVWVNYDNIVDGNKYSLVEQHTSGSNRWHFGAQSGAFIFAYNNGAWNVPVNKGITLHTGIWYHLGITRDGNSWRLWQNGQQVDSTITASDSIPNPTGSVHIGWMQNDNYFIDGKMDEVKIYDYARTQAQIAYDYNKGKPVAHYKFDEGGGPIAHDEYSTAGSGAAAPVGWWRMDEGSWNGTAGEVVDSSGSHHGVRAGNATTASSSKIGPYAGTFDGSGDYVSVTTTSTLNSTFSGTNPFTIEQWVNFGGSNTYYPSFNKGSFSTGFTIHGIDGRIEGGDGTNTFDVYTMLGESLIGDGWRHIAMTYDGSVFRAYLDGLYTDYHDWTYGIGNTSGYNIKIGGFWGSSYQGQIDDVRIYDYARTPVQIYNDYKTTHGTLVADTKFVDGKLGKALTFDGTGDYVAIIDNDSLDFGTGDFSYSVWVKMSVDDGSYPTILRKGDGSGGDARWGLSVDNNAANDGILYTHFTDTEANSATNLSTTAGYNDDNWHFVMITFTNGENARLYIDGVLKDTLNVSSLNNMDSAADLYIGRYSAGYYFNGLIDDVRIYNYARSASQVMQDYNAGVVAHAGVSSGVADPWGGALPIGHWRMDENTGALARDASGNGYDGTLTNMTEADWVHGKHGSALDFDGSGDYVRTSTINLASTFTVAFWMKPTTLYDYGDPLSAGTADKYLTFVTYANGSMDYNLGNGTSWGSGVTAAAATFVNDTWYHIAGTASGGQIELFVNGISKGTASNSNSINQVLNIGSRTVSSYDFNGLVDDVKVYGYARTQAQVAWDYNRGKPVGHWRMDEATSGSANGSSNIKDDSGKGNHGSGNYGANTTGMSWTTGKFGGALSFDGADDWVNCGADTSLQFGTGDFSVSAWVKPAAEFVQNVTGHNTVVARNHADAGVAYTGWKLYYYKWGGWEFRLYDGSDYDTTLAGNAPAEWTHLAGVRNGTQTRLYRNGVLVATGGCPADLSVTGGSYQTVAIGSTRHFATAEHFNGTIDDVRIYNYARTADQIMQDYQQGLATKLGD